MYIKKNNGTQLTWQKLCANFEGEKTVSSTCGVSQVHGRSSLKENNFCTITNNAKTFCENAMLLAHKLYRMSLDSRGELLTLGKAEKF